MTTNVFTYTDPLTGLYTHPIFLIIAEQYLKLAKRFDYSAVLILLDLDGLEAINTQHGRAEGDWALKQVAEVLRHYFRESDVMGRLVEDEFAFLGMGVRDKDADILAGRLNERLAQVTTAATRSYSLSVSAGLAWNKLDAPLPLDELMAHAMTAMETQQQRKHGA
jgi:diguanylate cyclase (GGDEF)-like protein